MLGKGTKEGTCSLSDAGGNVQGKEMLGKGQRKEHARLVTRVEMCAGKKCSQMCQRALTQKQMLGAGGALELGDLGLLEDGHELCDALVSDPVALETAKEGWSEDGERS